MAELFVSYAVRKNKRLVDIREAYFDYHDLRSKNDVNIIALRLSQELEKTDGKEYYASVMNWKLFPE